MTTFNNFDMICMAIAMLSIVSFVFFYIFWVKPAKEIQEAESFFEIRTEINNCLSPDEFKSAYAEITYNKLNKELFKVWCYAVVTRLSNLKRNAYRPTEIEFEGSLLTDTRTDELPQVAQSDVSKDVLGDTVIVPNPNESDEFNDFVKVIYSILDLYERAEFNHILHTELAMKVSKVILS